MRKPIYPYEVRESQELQIESCKQMAVCEKVPLQQARERGHQVLRVRSEDVKEADGPHRSKLVAKETKTYIAPELFAATPRAEPVKHLMRRAAQDRSLRIMLD